MTEEDHHMIVLWTSWDSWINITGTRTLVSMENHFRETHARSLNFYKYRTTNPVGHPHCLFEFDEEKFMDTYVQVVFHNTNY